MNSGPVQILGLVCLGAIGGLLAGVIAQDLLARLLIALAAPRVLLAAVMAGVLPLCAALGAAVPFIARAMRRRRSHGVQRR